MAYRDAAIATEKCPGCQADVPSGTEICPSCGAPIDPARFAELELKVLPDLRKARRFLGVVTALEAFGLLVASTRGLDAVIAHGFSVVFFGICFLTAFKRPLGASIAAMSLFLFSEAMALGMGRIELLFQGIILKIVLVTLLAAGIRSGYRARDLRGQWRKRDWTVGIGVLVGSGVVGFALGLFISAG